MSAPRIPYPPSPPDVPEGLTDYSDSFTRKQNRLLAGLFVFLIFYMATIILCAMVGVWCVLTFVKWPVLKTIGLLVSSFIMAFLLKGFFKSQPMDKEMHIEITEEEQPVLFEFINQLCEELGAPEPNKVFVAPDVNAMVMMHTSLLNLFVEPKKDLLIGLGLVNCMNLSEFKVVLAHEFGHFCNLGPAHNYTVVIQEVILNLLLGEDLVDRMADWCKKKDALKWLGYSLGGCMWLGRSILFQCFKLIVIQYSAVSREQEFHADLVAVSAAGSDAATHDLLRARFGMQCLNQALDDLVIPARDHKLYSNDLYLHQGRAAAVVRRKKKEPELGLPPHLPTPTSGKTIRVFDAEQDELEDEDDTPPMLRSHPSDADREENVKRQFVEAPIDHRSPWILFNEPADLKERMTYKFYRMVFRIPKKADLADAVKVQEYIDNEHADTTYDAKYHGAYDDRPLAPGDLTELNGILFESPWTEDRMEKVYDKIFEGCKEHAETRVDLLKDRTALRESVVGKPSSKMKQRIKDVEKKIDDNWEWFKSFDRRVYLLHVQMAAQVNKEWKDELVERYRFQAAVQRLYEESQHHQERAFLYAKTLFSMSPNEVHPEFLGEVMQVLRESWRALKKIVQDAREINLPAMKNFEEGERLADFILKGKIVPEPPLSYIKGNWCQKLVDQLGSVRSKCFRLHFKSVGGILTMQEKVAAAWVAARAPVDAEVVEPIAAEVVPVDAIAVEVIPDDAVPVEPHPFDSLPAEVMPDAHSLPPEPVAPTLAAFVASPLAFAPPPPAIPQITVVPAPAPATSVEVPKLFPQESEAIVEPAPAPLAPPITPEAAHQVNDAPREPEPEPRPPEAESTMPKPEAHSPEPDSESIFGFDAMQPPAPTPAAAEQGADALRAPEPAAPVAAEPAQAEPVIDSPLAFDATPPTPATPMTEEAKPESLPEPKAEEPPTLPTPPPLPVPAAKPPDSPVAEIFSLDAAEAPAPAEEIFTLDADEIAAARAPKPPPMPPKLAEPKPAAAPVAAEEIFTLDADEIAARTSAPAPAAEALPIEAEALPVEAEVLPIEAEEVLDLGADAIVAEIPAVEALPIEAEIMPIDAEEVLDLGADAIVAEPVDDVPVATPAKPVAKPASGIVATPVKPALSGTTAVPAARPAFGSGVTAASATTRDAANGTAKPGPPKRPTVKITLVKPGEKSPFAK